MTRYADIASHRRQLAPEFAIGNVALARAQQKIRAEAEHLVLAKPPAQVGVRCPDTIAFVVQLYFAKPCFGWALGHEIKYPRRVGRAVERSAESRENLHLLVLFQRRR